MFEEYLKQHNIRKDAVSELELYKHMSVYTRLPLIEDIKIESIDIDYINKKFNEDFVKKYLFLPLGETNEKIKIAVSMDNNYELLSQIKMYYSKKIELVICPKSKVKAILSIVYSKNEILGNVNKIKSENSNKQKLIDLDEDLLDEKVTKKFINNVIKEAIAIKASDIHINPERENIFIRFRVDGIMIDYEKTNISALSSIMTTIKIFSQLDIAEKRKPQDGQFSIYQGDGDEVNIRVAIINTVYGEKATLRILNANSGVSNLNDIKATDNTKEKIERMINNSKGMVLITGATGSGKSTTLQAILNTINDGKLTIITIEDPVEHKIDNVIQTEVNVKAGVTFASGLRSILRLDPDVIMIGEIRDEETAEIAVRAAITGHMVYATLHTNSAISTISRLKDMGIEKYLLADSLEGIVNQKLVRRLCPHCKTNASLEKDSIYRKIFELGDEEIKYHKHNGCSKCRGTGYAGRVLLTEALIVDDNIRRLIIEDEKIEHRQDILEAQSFKTIKDDAILAVRNGITDFSEISKI